MKIITAKKSKKSIKDGANQIAILIVEDDQDLRESLATALRDEGYHVIWAQDADEAIVSVKAHKVNIVFMDICLPDMNGVEVYKAIKKIQPTATTVMMTGFFVQDLVNAAISAGAYDILYKPFTMDDILKMIKKITS
ncbi:MAG: response regulator [Verrucomicrobia bacterium]|nr:response regulator [Verrucomicrobiota bacterium]MBU1733989.1 response regulator [Verrucomicrobiota bacterium]MBU1856643.1 response regulator [Verrucomicrobiota bacterium]